MNLLGHFYLDYHRPESHFAVGASTPDLLSIFNPALRIKQRHLEGLDSHQFHKPRKDFIDGVFRHFFADAAFHSSHWFNRETKVISRMIERFFPDQKINRKFFIAHVLLELLLDKVLLQEHPDLIPDYYQKFESSNHDTIRQTTELIARHSLPNYDGFLEKFTQKRYLARYADPAHIAFVMRRIMQRVHIFENDYLDAPPFYALMQEVEVRLSGNYQEVFEEIVRSHAVNQAKAS